MSKSASPKSATFQLGRAPIALLDKLVAEQQRFKKAHGVELSLSEIARLLIEKGLEANGKKR